MDNYAGFSPRLLLIENDEQSVEDVLRLFETDGYIAKWSVDSSEVLSVIDTFSPNIIIFSWKTVSLSGLDLCQKIRNNPNFDETKLLVITNYYNEHDAVRLLTIGVDDYIGRPISNTELQARAWSQLRFLRNKNLFSSARKVMRRASPVDLLIKNTSSDKTLKHKGILMNIELREVRRHGEVVQLREAEFRLLAVLLENPSRIHTRNELIYSLWEQPEKIDFRTIDVMIGRLRKALALPNRTDSIRAVRGLGYGLSLEDPLISDRKTKKIVKVDSDLDIDA